MEAIFKRFEDLDICGKVTLRSKLWELAYHDLTLMCAPPKKVKTKGGQKKWMTKQQRSTKCDPSYFEYLVALNSVQDSSSTLKRSGSSSEQTKQKRNIPMLDQFHPCL